MAEADGAAPISTFEFANTVINRLPVADPGFRARFLQRRMQEAPSMVLAGEQIPLETDKDSDWLEAMPSFDTVRRAFETARAGGAEAIQPPPPPAKVQRTERTGRSSNADWLERMPSFEEIKKSVEAVRANSPQPERADLPQPPSTGVQRTPVSGQISRQPAKTSQLPKSRRVMSKVEEVRPKNERTPVGLSNQQQDQINEEQLAEMFETSRPVTAPAAQEQLTAPLSSIKPPAPAQAPPVESAELEMSESAPPVLENDPLSKPVSERPLTKAASSEGAKISSTPNQPSDQPALQRRPEENIPELPQPTRPDIRSESNVIEVPSTPVQADIEPESASVQPDTETDRPASAQVGQPSSPSEIRRQPQPLESDKSVQIPVKSVEPTKSTPETDTTRQLEKQTNPIKASGTTPEPDQATERVISRQSSQPDDETLTAKPLELAQPPVTASTEPVPDHSREVFEVTASPPDLPLSKPPAPARQRLIQQQSLPVSPTTDPAPKGDSVQRQPTNDAATVKAIGDNHDFRQNTARLRSHHRIESSRPAAPNQSSLRQTEPATTDYTPSRPNTTVPPSSPPTEIVQRQASSPPNRAQTAVTEPLSPPEKSEGQSAAGETTTKAPDMDQLARQVYPLIKHMLVVERERSVFR